MPDPVRSIGVFCGSSGGNRPEYVEAARATGAALAARGLTLVYGGGGKGMMGAVADGALDAGGQVIGVIPSWMVEKEAAHQGIQRMIEVETMLERKTRMAELSDAFLVLPGGLGTLDELFEMATWSQLRTHGCSKPQGILNVAGYYDDLCRWLDRAIGDGFIHEATPGMPIASNDLHALLDMLCS
ncbi:Lysine decarboxylase family [hydrothermal vent metagenome]|uniref:Lysine decarboxylase family n=1 Tax=hydrothermal vent metagenome TaxID=652676 RepID=A0A3B1DT79_9ZZZZ